MNKDNKFDLIPYPLSKWSNNVRTILTKYYDEVPNENTNKATT